MPEPASLQIRRSVAVALLAVVAVLLPRDAWVPKLAGNAKSAKLLDAGELIPVPGSGGFFDAIAPSYDILNCIISLGFDQSWRRAAASASVPSGRGEEGGSLAVLDVAAGTGDLTQVLFSMHTFDQVRALDPSPRMLSLLRSKVDSSVQVYEGVAEELPFGDESFDAVTVAFGVRNFADRRKGLAEMHRVLRQGGKLVVLEMSAPQGGSLTARLSRMFIGVVMPRLGAVVSGNAAAYEYLRDSLNAFPPADAFRNMLSESGFIQCKHDRLWPFGSGPDMYVAVK